MLPKEFIMIKSIDGTKTFALPSRECNECIVALSITCFSPKLHCWESLS